MSVGSKVSHLVNVPPPVLTAYVDVNPANPRNQGAPRGYVRWFKSAAQALLKELPSPPRKAFRAEVRRVGKYLERMRPRSRGLIVFAGPEVWEVIPLQVEVSDELHWGKPSLQQMSWVLDEHRLRGAVLITGSGARFFRFWLGRVVEDEPLGFSFDVSPWRKPHLVGPSTPGVSKRHGIQRDSITARMREQRKHFLRRLSHRIIDWAQEARISSILLLGKAEDTEVILNTMPVEARKQVTALPKVLPNISSAEINKKLKPILNDWERDYEAVVVDQLISGQTSHRSVTGLDRTLTQLQRGQVSELITSRGLTGSVQQCTNCGWVARSDDRLCAICGSKRQARSLRTVLPELAASQSVPMEVVAGKAASKLGAVGGVGAWLRSARKRSPQKLGVPMLSQLG